MSEINTFAANIKQNLQMVMEYQYVIRKVNYGFESGLESALCSRRCR